MATETARPPRRASSCMNANGTAKWRWTSRHQAKDVARKQGRREGVKFSVYACPTCDGYHVAHR
jgi:hypothetical protein